MDAIRSSPYIDEVNSGEEPREECPMYKEVELADHIPEDKSIEALIRSANIRNGCIVVADTSEISSRGLLVVHVDKGVLKDQLRVAPRDVIEVCVNVRMANMDMGEFRALAKKTNSDVFDSGR